MNTIARQKTAPPFIVPWALFAGVVISFACSCLQGWRTTQVNQFTRFERFHQVLCPESLFYPTASQMQMLAQKRTKKDLINVIIGGSSILNGARQFPDEVWSDELARLLGPDYRVLNLGVRAAHSGECGAIIAETLLKRRRLIFLTDMTPCRSGHLPDGDRHRYFFWDAWYKGLIDKKLPRRAAWMATLRTQGSSDLKLKELRAGAWLNAECYFNDLWNTLAYTTGGTVWNSVTQNDSFLPRMLLKDNEHGPLPMEARLAAMDFHLPPEKFSALVIRASFRRDGDGRWELEPMWLKAYKEGMENIHPNEVLRRRTLVLVHRSNPYCTDRWSTEEQEKWSVQMAATRQVLGELGMGSLIVGEGFALDDYADHFHLTRSGGEKLAALAAPAIRALAKELGYEDELKNGKSNSL